jgi:hypothetical protein
LPGDNTGDDHAAASLAAGHGAPEEDLGTGLALVDRDWDRDETVGATARAHKHKARRCHAVHVPSVRNAAFRHDVPARSRCDVPPDR